MACWLSIKGAADYLGISRQTLYREMASGRLQPDGRVGQCWRFSKATLDRYVRGSIAGDDAMEHLPGEEDGYAVQDYPDGANAPTRDCAGRSGPISGAGEMDRREGAAEKKGGRCEVVRGRGRAASSAASRGRGRRVSAYTREVTRLRRKVAEGDS